MKTIKINDIEFDADEIRNAKWTTESSNLAVGVSACHANGEDDQEQEIERVSEDECHVLWTATLIRAEVEDEEPWECALAHVTALDGRQYTLYVEDSYAPRSVIIDGWVDYCTTGAPDIRTIEDEDGWVTSDLTCVCDTLPRLSVDDGMPGYADYAVAPERYVSELPATHKVWIDRARGFANEWTIYIDPSGTVEPREKWEAVDESYIVSYLADAICTTDVYRHERFSTQCCSAMLVEE